MPSKAIFSRPAIAEEDLRSREDKIAALVSAGGSSAISEAERKEIARQKRHAKKVTEPVVNVRLPRSLLEEVDRLRLARAGKVSRNTWIVLAIEDQVARLRGTAGAPERDNLAE